MRIQCGSIAELVQVCAALVREGVTFRADTATLEVTMTGGF